MLAILGNEIGHEEMSIKPPKSNLVVLGSR